MNIKEAMKKAKETGLPQKVTERMTEPSTTKVNISIRLDYDLLNWLKEEAQRQGLPYQILTQSILRKAMIEYQHASESELHRLRILEEQMAILQRVVAELKHG